MNWTLSRWIEEMVDEFGAEHRYRITDALRWYAVGAPRNPAKWGWRTVRSFVEGVIR